MKPKHIAITLGGNLEYAKRHLLSVQKTYSMVMDKILEVMQWQVEENIPIVSVYLLTGKVQTFPHFDVLMDCLERFFTTLAKHEQIAKNKIKVSVFGKWYNLPSRVVEGIKRVIDETRDYDSFFLNLCINYDGREEIVDACKLLGKKMTLRKLDPENVRQEDIKEHLYTSYFLPPDIIIKTGFDKRLHGFLLWDSPEAHIYFSHKTWPEFTKEDFLRAVKEWERGG
ncbi:di-trans,poly-cis-decaprenylcistransferase [Candidatus Woesearchaeota archaeon]|nr:di-trans,poly-cis-decaprenylcistransferase [Candidatus Woesearchaeota archaeon]